MKNVLFATSAIVAFTAGGAAFADSHGGGVSISGEARMGLVFLDDDDDGNDDVYGTSRIRVKFAGTGTSDNGLTFGFNIRADNAAGGADQAGVTTYDDDADATTDEVSREDPGVSTAGDVFISGSFGTLTYNDTDSAVKKRTSNVDEISLTGLDDVHEIARGSQAGPRIRYDYDFDSFGFSISTQGDLEEIAVAVGGSFDFGSNSVAFGLGYDDLDEAIVVSLGAGFGSIDAKAAYSTSDAGDDVALSLKYASGPLSVAGFVAMTESSGADTTSFGVGLGYDMGGGLELKTGIASSDVSGGGDILKADLGFAMSF